MAVTQAQLKTDKQQLDMYGNTMERILMQNSYFQLAHVIFYTANSERDHKKDKSHLRALFTRKIFQNLITVKIYYSCCLIANIMKFRQCLQNRESKLYFVTARARIMILRGMLWCPWQWSGQGDLLADLYDSLHQGFWVTEEYFIAAAPIKTRELKYRAGYKFQTICSKRINFYG